MNMIPKRRADLQINNTITCLVFYVDTISINWKLNIVLARVDIKILVMEILPENDTTIGIQYQSSTEGPPTS